MPSVAGCSRLDLGAVFVERSINLSTGERFFIETRKSDARVLLQVNGDDHLAERGRTRSVAGTLQPVWDSPLETFILTDVEVLVLEVRQYTTVDAPRYLAMYIGSTMKNIHRPALVNPMIETQSLSRKATCGCARWTHGRSD